MAKKRANGEGNIRKRKDGRWEGRYTAGYEPTTGKRIIKNVLGKTQAEVKEKLAAALEDTKDLDVPRSDDYTVGSWLTNWYTLYAKPNVRVSTAEYYRRSIELHVNPRIGDIKLNKLTGRDLQKLYQDLRENGRLREVQKEKSPGLSASTVRGIHLMLHNALDRAVKERLIQRNPTADCIAPKLEKKEMKFLPAEDMKAYLDEADRRHVLPMFYLELVSGLRKGELVAAPLVRPGHCKPDNLSKQTSYPRRERPHCHHPAQDRNVRQTGIHPAKSSGTAPTRAPQAPRQPLYVSLHQNRRDVLPGLHRNAPQANIKVSRIELYKFSRLTSHFCDCRTTKWCRRKNRQQYAGPLRRRFHAKNLHPRHPPETRTSRRKDGKFHGQGHVSVGQARKTAGTSYPEVSSRFRLFPRVGHRVGQDRRQPNPYRTTPNRTMRKHPQYSEKYTKRKQHRNKATLC